MSDMDVLHWSMIQTPNYAIKPTLKMLYLGEKVVIKSLIKGQSRRYDSPEQRTFLFDKSYVYQFFVKNVFQPTSNLSPKQFHSLIKEFYFQWLVENGLDLDDDNQFTYLED